MANIKSTCISAEEKTVLKKVSLALDVSVSSLVALAIKHPELFKKKLENTL